MLWDVNKNTISNSQFLLKVVDILWVELKKVCSPWDYMIELPFEVDKRDNFNLTKIVGVLSSLDYETSGVLIDNGFTLNIITHEWKGDESVIKTYEPNSYLDGDEENMGIKLEYTEDGGGYLSVEADEYELSVAFIEGKDEALVTSCNGSGDVRQASKYFAKVLSNIHSFRDIDLVM